jgi:prevent-host-death family protein
MYRHLRRGFDLLRWSDRDGLGCPEGKPRREHQPPPTRDHVCFASWAHSPEYSMETLDVFSVRDLRKRSSDLLRDAELGQVAVITKHGRPAILAVPFDRQLLDLGVHRALALKLYEGRHLTMTQAAKVAGMPLDEFIDLLGAVGLPAVDYPPEELAEELHIAQ